jgi:allantoin racemase
MRIRVIAPITDHGLAAQTQSVYVQYARSDSQISVVCLDIGPASIESIYEDSLAVPQVVRCAIEAERDGVDAVIIDCMNDPGLEAAREAVSIPVVGAAQSGMLLAGMLAHKFSVVSTARRDVYPTAQLARRYGMSATYASTRWVDIPVLELHIDQGRMLDALIEESKRAIEQDGAHCIVFGCTGMRGIAGAVEKALKNEGFDIIVIDPSLAALKWAELLVGLNLTPSRLTYPAIGGQLLPEHQGLLDSSVAEVPGQNTTAHHIHIMVPVVQGYREDDWLVQTQQDYARYAWPSTRVTVSAITEGPPVIETQYLKAMSIPGILRLARQAEGSGATALVIDCMSDPGLDAVREMVSIPVVGPAQSSSFLAASLAHRFSILGTRSDMGHKFVNQVREYGLSSKLASVQTVGLTVQQVESDPEDMFIGLLQAGERAVKQDGAHILIPGCTGMIGIANRLQAALAAQGLHVPVIEAPAAGMKMAEALSDLGMSHSKLTYPTPPTKELAGYKDLEFS